MTQTPKPNLSDYEEEKVPLDDVLRQLLKAKPLPKAEPKAAKPKPGN